MHSISFASLEFVFLARERRARYQHRGGLVKLSLPQRVRVEGQAIAEQTPGTARERTSRISEGDACNSQ